MGEPTIMPADVTCIGCVGCATCAACLISAATFAHLTAINMLRGMP